MMRKRILSLILTFAMLMTLLPVMALADQTLPAELKIADTVMLESPTEKKESQNTDDGLDNEISRDTQIVTVETTALGVTSVTFAAGDGSEINPYQISTPEQLDAVRNNLSASYILVNDIDLSGWGNWEPIGTSFSEYFRGTFDGNNYTIKNMTINIVSDESVYAGLFGYVRSCGTIRNVNMKDSNIVAASSSDSAYAGGIVGYVYYGYGTIIIENCTNSGDISISAEYYANAGGIIGGTESSLSVIEIENCTNSGDVSASSNSSVFDASAGGIIGKGSGTVTVTNCTNRGEILASAYTGGIVGFATYYVTITNCANSGDIFVYASSYPQSYAGGMVGCTTYYVTITDCANSGEISASASSSSSNRIYRTYAGGMVGGMAATSFPATITDCINSAAIFASSSHVAYAGGIVGETTYTITIENCTNSGDVSASSNIYGANYGASASAGGIVGYADTGTMILENCINSGPISAATHSLVFDVFAGGLVGYLCSALSIEPYCYYPSDISAIGGQSDNATITGLEYAIPVGSGGNNTSADGLEIISTLSLEVGDIYFLTAYLNNPLIDWNNDESTACTWTSSDASVVGLGSENSATSTGSFTLGSSTSGSSWVSLEALSPGMSTITVQLNNGGSVSCVVTVTESSGNNDQSDEITINLYSNRPSLSLTEGESIELVVAVFKGNEYAGGVSAVTFTVENPSVIEITGSNVNEYYRYITLKALTEGTSHIFIGYGEKVIKAQITVSRQYGNVYTIYNVPEAVYESDYATNFYNFSGMYIDSFSTSTNANGSSKISFDVYNTKQIYGVVEVCNSEGKVINCIVIDKGNTSGVTGIKETLIDGTASIISDIWNSNLFTYRQESGYSSKTSVSIDSVPKGGYIRITNDPEASGFAAIINAIDIVFNLKSIFDTVDGWSSSSSYTFTKELTSEILTNAIGAQICTNSSKFGSELTKKLFKNITFSANSMGNFTDSVINALNDVNIFELVDSVLVNMSWSIGEKVFTQLSGLPGQVLNGLFSVNKVGNCFIQIHTYLNSGGSGVIEVQVPGDNSRTSSGIVVKSETGFDTNTALQVYEVSYDENLINSVFNGNVPAALSGISNVILYNISLLQNGTEVQPADTITIEIPIPENLTSYVDYISIYRVETDGSLTEMNLSVQNGVISFSTDHLSLYALVADIDDVTSYTITATAGTGGSISPSGSISVTEGDDQTFNIKASSGYRVTNVLVDGKSVGAVSSYTFDNVTADHTISASFTKTSSSSSSTTAPGRSSSSSSTSSSSSGGTGSTGDNNNTVGTKINFTDVSEADWFYDSVAFVVENGLFDGMGDGAFGPKKAMTREMFVTVLGRVAEILGVSTIGYTNSFSDVQDGMWYSNYIAWGAANGLVEGYDENTFGLGRSITREQMATLIVRFTDYVNVTLRGSASVQFTDAQNIRDYAKDAVDTCSKAGLINGYDDGTFRPSGNATRAEVATIFMRFMKQYISY